MEDIPTLLGAGSRFRGLLTYRGSARIEGELEGEVAASGRLVLGPGARVRAKIEVDELVVAGHLEGEVRARMRLEILAGGRVDGSVATPRLAVAEGAHLSARCATGAAAAVGGSPAGAPERPPAEASPARASG